MDDVKPYYSYWYGLRKDGSQTKATDEEVMRFASEQKIPDLNLMWNDHATIVLKDGTRLARTKKGALERGWEDISIAPFDFH